MFILYSHLINPTFIIIWFLIFAIMLISEIISKDFSTLCYSVSAFITFICAILFVNPLKQIIIFLLLSAILKLASFPIRKKVYKKRRFKKQISSLIGRYAIVTKPISENKVGEVSIDGILWPALTFDNQTFQINQRVYILSTYNYNLVTSDHI